MANIISDETSISRHFSKIRPFSRGEGSGQEGYGRMLDYIDMLNELDTSAVELCPMYLP